MVKETISFKTLHKISLFPQQDFHARLSNDLVELSQIRKNPNRKTGHPLPPLPGEVRPKSAIVLESSMTQNDASVRLRNNKDFPDKTGILPKPSPLSCSSTPLPGRKMRPVSTGGRVESAEMLEFKDRDENRNQLQLLMYIVGGREVGQVTVFKRPISMWKLDLTRTF